MRISDWSSDVCSSDLWSRNCDGASLVIFSDFHDQDATQEEKTYLVPYIVHGRPRVADVAWRRSDIGGADVTLRFDCDDSPIRLFIDLAVGLTCVYHPSLNCLAQYRKSRLMGTCMNIHVMYPVR